MTPVRLEPAAPRSRVKHSTSEPQRYQCACLEFVSLLIPMSYVSKGCSVIGDCVMFLAYAHAFSDYLCLYFNYM